VSHLPPIRREVLVDLDPDRAFELFTAQISDWWPLASHSVFGAHASVTFTDEKLVETLGDQTAVWGEVIEWQPGRRLVISWHAGHSEAESTRVSVSFTEQGEQTLVALEHSGWEAREDPIAIRREYGQGWPIVLASYRRFLTRHRAQTSPQSSGSS
jgi:uncharacterized protein YndB with AHSA1/START domain